MPPSLPPSTRSSRSPRPRRHERPGHLDSGRHERLDDRRHRNVHRLVADFSEAAADRRPGRARQRCCHREFPDLHAEPGRCRSRVKPGRLSARRRRAHGQHGAGEVSAIAVDPSDPSGNTVYAAGASGGIWKTTDFLTTSPSGPTWIPLTNFGPSSGINIGAITVFARNSNPNDSIIIAATGSATSGENNTASPGVGFLISQDGGATWNLYDSTDNVDANGNILPINSTSRNREFVGTTAYAITVDPQLTPNGQVIIYAALSGPNGGIWRSEDTGQTWTQLLAGNATSVVLNPNSGTVLNPSHRHRRSGQPPDRLCRFRGVDRDTVRRGST